MATAGPSYILILLIFVFLLGIALGIGGLILTVKSHGSAMNVIFGILMMVAGVITAVIPIVVIVVALLATAM